MLKSVDRVAPVGSSLARILYNCKMLNKTRTKQINQLVNGPMAHVELGRLFALVDKDKEIPLETPSSWGRKIYGFMGWSELLALPRVVLLAEAGSGKTEEFQARCWALQGEGRPAFFVRVEDLADDGLDASLDGDAAALLQAWKQGSEIGYFFIDSVDEARLNHKSFEKALRQFARELGSDLGRAHVLVSCRISDWKGRGDYNAVERWLPMPIISAPALLSDADGALLNPIFEKQEKKKEASEVKSTALQIVRLVSLCDTDRRALAIASGVSNPDAFMAAIARQGLGPLADRPGDLLELAEYWKAHGAFASLVEMTEFSVTLKLTERDTSRPDNAILTLERVRKGAERIAAALTLGHTFTVRAPNQEADPTLAMGALDVKDILPDWSDSERGTLLRRGVFAPATYGRVRFHHRGTQEYLAAQWFDQLLKAGCDRRSVMELLFASRYGTDTVVPSLRAEAAWLALWHQDVCAELVRREPTTLIQNGDPASLPVSVRRDLLLRYATLHQSGDISNDRLDDRALWLFSRGDLADAVIAAWGCNTREDFRLHALRIVRDGKLSKCQPLWREVLAQPLREKSRDYLRAVALDVARACCDTDALVQAAATLAASPGQFGEVTATHLTEMLFPQHFSVQQLLAVIAECQPVSGNSVGGFAYVLDKLFAACRNREERTALFGGLADLAITAPFKDEYSGISRRHHRLAEHLVPLVMQALEELASGYPAPELIRALMAIERGDRYHRHDKEKKLAESVQGRPLVNQALLWADVDGASSLSPARPERPEYIHQIHLYGGSLWGFGIGDLQWLIGDITGTRVLSDRRMALGIAVGVLMQAGEWDARQLELANAVKGQIELERALTELSTPPPPSAAMERMAIRDNVYKKKREAEEAEAKQCWRNLRAELQAEPSRISDPVRLAPPDVIGFHDLQNLTRWLCSHTGNGSEDKAVLHWRALEAGFGSAAIATAYRNAMQYFWRVMPPRWPERKDGGVLTTYFVTELAHAGVCLEAAEDADWAKRLTPAEALRASELACRSDNSRPAWLDDLIKEHPAIAILELRRTLDAEWIAPNDNQRRFLYDYAHANGEIIPEVRDLLIELALGDKPPAVRAAELSLRIIQHARNWVEAAKLAATATARLDNVTNDSDAELVAVNIALLLMADAKAGFGRLQNWIDSAAPDSRSQRALFMLARLFGRDHALVPRELNTISVEDLLDLSRLAYKEINLLEDVEHEGSYTPDLRDAAEAARSAILSAIIDRPGPEAYAALVAIGTSGIAGIKPTRFRELAHGKVERDAEIVPWTPKDVVAFEATSMLPVKTADNFYAVVLRVLDEIQYGLTQEDMSSRRLLQSAANEEQVQGWLGEQFKLRARGRYHVHREPEVADKKEPDIIASAIAISVEVAIEVKDANKDWTVQDLEDALTTQLAKQYLRPANRRHGVLVITLHTPRTWRDPVDKSILSFAQVIERLTALATTITSNQSGLISVRVIGIDAN